MVQSKSRANYQASTLQLINIFWKIKGCSEKNLLKKIIGGHVPPAPCSTALLIDYIIMNK